MIINYLPSAAQVIVSLPPVADEASFTINSSGRITKCDFSNYKGISLTFPDTIRGIAVKELTQGAITTELLGNVQNIVIPYSIGWYTFSNKTWFPYGIKSIKTQNVPTNGYLCSFNETINDVQTNQIVSLIGPYSFQNCLNIKKNPFNRVRVVGKYAFYKSSIDGRDLENLEDIGADAFGYCNNLKGEIKFPNALTISTESFRNCKNITILHFPLVTNLNGLIAESDNSGVHGMQFRDCGNLSDIYFDTLEELVLSNTETECPFFNCEKLQNIYVPSNKVEEIKNIFLAQSWGQKYADLIKPLPAETE